MRVVATCRHWTFYVRCVRFKSMKTSTMKTYNIHSACFASTLLLMYLSKDVSCSTVTIIGNYCAPTDVCSTTPATVCNAATSTCLVDIGQSCAYPNTAKCKTGTSCDSDNLCKLDVSQSCAAPNAANCKTGLVCDTVDNKCKLEVLQSCASPNTAGCKTGLACDTTDNKCRVDILQSCASLNVSNCKTGLACDTTDSKCRYKVSSVCTTGVDRCVPGATCASVTAQCSCNSVAYTANADTGTCDARAKKVGGNCTVGVGACDDPNASCTNSKCVCNANHQVNPADATCFSRAMGLVASTFLLFAVFFVHHTSM